MLLIHSYYLAKGYESATANFYNNIYDTSSQNLSAIHKAHEQQTQHHSSALNYHVQTMTELHVQLSIQVHLTKSSTSRSTNHILSK